MKRVALALAAFAIIGGVACGTPPPTPTKTVTVAPPAPAPAPAPSGSVEDAVRAALLERDITVTTDQAIRDIGSAICSGVARDGLYAVVSEVSSTFFEGDTSLGAYATGVYVGAYCPELLPAEGATNSTI